MIAFLVSSDISKLRQTSWTNMPPSKKQTSHVKRSVETITETWFSRKNYPMNEFSNSSGWPTICFSTCLNSRWDVIAHRCRKTLSTSWMPREENFFLGKYRTQTWTKQPLQPACNIVMIRIQQLRSPKTSRARDVELYLRSLFGLKCNSTPLNWGE